MNDLLKIPNEWQYIDERNGLLFCWYTKNFIDNVLTTADFSNMNVLELGSGASTLWWGTVAKKVVSVENNESWFSMVSEGINELGLQNKIEYNLAIDKEQYLSFLKSNTKFDLIIVDGAFREDCMDLINESNINKGGILILDNFEYMPSVVEKDLLRINNVSIFPQPNHYNWRTAYWIINSFQTVGNDHEKNAYEQKKLRGLV